MSYLYLTSCLGFMQGFDMGILASDHSDIEIIVKSGQRGLPSPENYNGTALIHKIFIERVALAKQGDNALGSVCPSVRLFVNLSELSCLKIKYRKYRNYG